MTLQERVENYSRVFPDRPPMHTNGRWLEGLWIGGNNYRGSGYYGAYPPDYLKRVAALFPDLITQRLLHLFSGSLTKDAGGVRVDINPAVRPDVVGDARQLPFPNQSFDLILADTPYSEWHATKYGTAMPDRRSVVRETARVTAPGGFLVWLDTKLPMFRKDEWNWLGLAQVLGDGETEDDWIWRGSVQLVRSTNHDYRGSAIFERRGVA